MCANRICFCVFVLFVLFLSVEGQVCSKRAVVTSTAREPYVYTYREQYQTKCWYGGTCTKSRIRSNISYRVVARREIKNIEICCDGYMRDDTSTDDNIICKPICMPSCSNGYCKSPSECACNDGYLLDTMNPHTCLPQCQDCVHGNCVAPETCECNFGYSLNGTCQPVCTEPCNNGKCVAPDTCECHEGFRKTENNTCEPYCSKGCTKGICIQPETCGCEEGYVIDGDECIPHCNNDCGNGTCISPDTCECDPGYTFENSTCQPICPDECVNGYCSAPFTCVCDSGYTFQWGNCQPYCSMECGIGRCVAPETCQCEFGFQLNNSCDPYCCEPVCLKPCIHGSCIEPEVCDCDDGYKKDFLLDICVPDCINDCGNGTCVEPNTCECHPGFEEKESKTVDDEPVCEPICKNCEGSCIEPYTCVCDSLFQTRDETADGEDCDCFENCLDSSRQCERTICVLKSTTESSTEFSTTLNEVQNVYVDDGLTNQLADEFGVATDDVTEKSNTETTIEMQLPTNFVQGTSNTFVIIDTYTAKQQKEKEARSSVWIYVVIAVLLMIIVTTMIILVIKRNAVLHFIRGGGSYVIEDKAEDTCSPSQSIDMRFSTNERTERETFR